MLEKPSVFKILLHCSYPTATISWIIANSETGLATCVEKPPAIYVWLHAARTLHLVKEVEVCDCGLVRGASK